MPLKGVETDCWQLPFATCIMIMVGHTLLLDVLAKKSTCKKCQIILSHGDVNQLTKDRQSLIQDLHW
jgi:hypothetical protein